MNAPEQQRSIFRPRPVKPGPFGLHYTILDHRGKQKPMASATWAERMRHGTGASRFLPRLSFSVSSLGLATLVVAGTFAIQEAGSRVASTFGRASEHAHLLVKVIGLFGPLIVIGFLLLAGILFSATRIWIPAIAQYWLSLGECPSCRYGLASIEPEADGCTVCPECGGAWELNRNAEPERAPERAGTREPSKTKSD
ncbi:MAG: hypothetical protein U0570_13370 [Phycisphaerales bacterium]